MGTPFSLSSVAGEIRLHPRVAYQGKFTDEAARQALADRVPKLVPFQGEYAGVMAVVDWDHRLPSRSFALRIYCYYEARSLAAGQEAFDDRLEDIGRRDRFPEFDVPDFAEIPADEAYEVELDPEGNVSGCRLVSAWRREITTEYALAAVDIARASEEFKKISTVARAAGRPRHLGGLEAVAWTPPCESGHPRWTLDVWYLLAFDGRTGSGRSLLVDLHERRIVVTRDFAVRTG